MVVLMIFSIIMFGMLMAFAIIMNYMEKKHVCNHLDEKCSELVERLSALEHDQWVVWSKSVMGEVSEERRKRWEKFQVPYSELDEATKELDREWTRKVLAEVVKYLDEKSEIN